MVSKLVCATLVGVAANVFTGCAIETSPPAEEYTPEPALEVESDITAGSLAYVTLRRDYRKCMAPVCGGYWVKDVNRNKEERYVSGLEFGLSGLDEELVAMVLEAPAEELVLRGMLGPKDPQFGTRAMNVLDAYRGLPGVSPIEGDLFFKAEDRDPPIQCFAAPCPNEVASLLNSGRKYAFDGYQVALAAKPHVDQAWLVDRIHHHDAIAAALFVYGEEYPAGNEVLLDASQVYVNVADRSGPCTEYPLAKCPEGMEWSFERDEDLCLHPNACVETEGCPSLVPAAVRGRLRRLGVAYRERELYPVRVRSFVRDNEVEKRFPM